jgi:hypothetical protein
MISITLVNAETNLTHPKTRIRLQKGEMALALFMKMNHPVSYGLIVPIACISHRPQHQRHHLR